MKPILRRRSLEVTYRKGRPVAAYFWLPRQEGDTAARTEQRQSGLVVDFAADGRPLGIEITSPATITAAEIAELLNELHEPPLDAAELQPLIPSA